MRITTGRGALPRVARKFLRALAYRRAERGVRQLRDGGGKLKQPQRLDADALADQCALGAEGTQWRRRRRVAAIHRRQGVQGGGVHAGGAIMERWGEVLELQ